MTYQMLVKKLEEANIEAGRLEAKARDAAMNVALLQEAVVIAERGGPVKDTVLVG